MIERLIRDFDWLLSILNTTPGTYRQVILQASEDEVTTLLLCTKVCGGCKHITCSVAMQNVKKLNYLKSKLARKNFVRNEKNVKKVIICVLTCLIRQVFNHVITASKDLLPGGQTDI